MGKRKDVRDNKCAASYRGEPMLMRTSTVNSQGIEIIFNDGNIITFTKNDRKFVSF
jgi:hypothetical protein